MKAARLTYTVAEAANALGIGESLLRRLIARGEFPALRLGGRIVVSKTAVQSLLELQAS